MPNPMLITAPAGAGKTSHAIQTILGFKHEHPWQMVWVLLPTELQINAFRDRLLDAHNGTVIFGVQYLTFYQLYDYLLNQMCVSQRQMQGGSLYRVVRRVVNSVALEYFEPIADKPGFIDLITRFIYELKQARVDPDHFEDYADHTGSPKDHDLAAIYDTYQQWVRRHDTVDREGAGWLALDLLLEDDTWLQEIGLLVVDGFQQFSPLQAQLLKALANAVQNIVVTLTYEEHRATTVQRAYARTRDRLLSLDVDGEWHEGQLPRPSATDSHPTLQYLEQYFLDRTAKPVASDGAVELIEAPDPEIEVRAVLRRVKWLLLEGYPPEQIVILARDLNRYADLLRSVATMYGLPLVFRRGIELLQNPAVSAILKLIDLQSPLELRRQDVLDILRSPYFHFPDLADEVVNILDRLSLQRQVISTRDDWLRVLRQPASSDEDGNSATEIDIPPELEQHLGIFFEQVTPPAKGTVEEFIAWIENLLGSDRAYLRDLDEEIPAIDDSVHFFEQARATTDPAVLVRDLYALRGFHQCLRDVLAAYELLGETSHEIEWREFRTELQLAIEQRRAEPIGGTYRRGRVLVTSVDEARGLPHDHVFILGLAEGVFPSRRHEDPLYSDRERDRFTDMTGYDLQTTTERQDDMAVFYDCLALARQSLTLTRPTLDENANPWPESVLWRAVQAIVQVDRITHYRAGDAPPLREAATVREVSVALIDAVQIGESDTLNELRLAHNWLYHHPLYSQRWQAVARGQAIEQRRLDRRAPFDHYAGILGDTNLINETKRILGATRQWSASQFNDYGYCPFRFFSRRLLHLEAFEEPTEGFDAAQLGSLQHEILENSYIRIAEEKLAIQPVNLERALEILDEEAAALFPQAPEKFGFRRSALWPHEQAEILRRLQRLIELDFSEDEDSPFIVKPRRRNQPVAKVAATNERYIYELEAAFGIDDAPSVHIIGEAGKLRTRGLIDRIDRVGDQLIVIDYKSGTHTPTNRDIEDGRNFQMVLYLQAAQQLVKRHASDLQVAAGFFWSIRSREGRGEIRADDDRLNEARRQLHHYIRLGRNGHFQVEPRKIEGGKCFTYCEFHKFCRIQHLRGKTNT